MNQSTSTRVAVVGGARTGRAGQQLRLLRSGRSLLLMAMVLLVVSRRGSLVLAAGVYAVGGITFSQK